MKERIVVTGMGVVTPIGTGTDEYWNNLVDGRCGISSISSFDASELAVQIAAEVKDFSPRDYMPGKLIHDTDAFTQYAFAAAAEALHDASYGSDDSAGARCGIVMGTAMAGIGTIASTQEILTNAVHKNVGPRFVPKVLGNIAAAQIAIEYGITGPSFTISTACASGGDAILMSALQLLAGEADMMLAVGADSTLCPLVIYSLFNARALSRENAFPEKACMPFDKGAKGFVIGEGGGALMLETETHAKERGARIYGELAGWANNNDAYHVTKPLEDGENAARCMADALRKAGLEPADVGFISAHGTGTLQGDKTEAKAMETVFGSSRPAVSSAKAATGHMMGGSGTVEAVTCLKAMETGIVPPTLNLTDPVADLDFVTETRRSADIQCAMTNAFGFGGQNSTIIFRRYEG